MNTEPVYHDARLLDITVKRVLRDLIPQTMDFVRSDTGIVDWAYEVANEGTRDIPLDVPRRYSNMWEMYSELAYNVIDWDYATVVHEYNEALREWHCVSVGSTLLLAHQLVRCRNGSEPWEEMLRCYLPGAVKTIISSGTDYVYDARIGARV